MGFMTSSENLMPVSSGFHSVFWRGRSQGFLTLNQHLTGLGRSPLQVKVFVGAGFEPALASTVNRTKVFGV